MATRTIYVCPTCGSDINAQYWLPPASRETTCTACGTRVRRSGESIRDAWATSFFILGYLPLALIIAVGMNDPSMSLGGRLLIGFLGALFPGSIGLSILGWILGLFVSIFAPNPEEPRRHEEDPEADNLYRAAHYGGDFHRKWGE